MLSRTFDPHTQTSTQVITYVCVQGSEHANQLAIALPQALNVSTRAKTAPNSPPWHRRLRAKRSRIRKALKQGRPVHSAARSFLAAHHGVCPRTSRRLLAHMGKAAKRPWKDQDGGREWRRPSSASASRDYWPGSWKASPSAQAGKAKFPTYDRSWDHEESITVVREERVTEAPTGEDGVARLAQQAVNTLRKAEQKVARIGRDQKEKKARFLAYERQIQAAHAEEEKRHQTAQERLANELVEALQQQDAAKENLAKTMEALFGGRATMDTTQERDEASAAWQRMQQRNP